MTTRFLQGWGVGPASTVGLQMLQDIYSEFERGEKVGYWTASIDLGKELASPFTCSHQFITEQACYLAPSLEGLRPFLHTCGQHG
jgi:sugar phosphate permease